MFDIGVEEEIIVINIKSDIADDSNINAAPRAGACDDPLDSNGNDDVAVGGRKRGRQGSELWSLYIDDVNSHQHKSAVCKHYRMLVNHHKKSESVKVHLNKCAPFRKLMNGMEEDKCARGTRPTRSPEATVDNNVDVDVFSGSQLFSSTLNQGVCHTCCQQTVEGGVPKTHYNALLRHRVVVSASRRRSSDRRNQDLAH
jgi:hypothetical protein